MTAVSFAIKLNMWMPSRVALFEGVERTPVTL